MYKSRSCKEKKTLNKECMAFLCIRMVKSQKPSTLLQIYTCDLTIWKNSVTICNTYHSNSISSSVIVKASSELFRTVFTAASTGSSLYITLQRCTIPSPPLPNTEPYSMSSWLNTSKWMFCCTTNKVLFKHLYFYLSSTVASSQYVP